MDILSDEELENCKTEIKTLKNVSVEQKHVIKINIVMIINVPIHKNV